jgi:hypothetical protein
MNMSQPRRFFTTIVAGLVAIMLAGCSVFGGEAVEETSYSVFERDGDVELRQYDNYAIARTFVASSYDEMDREAFGRLFDYISGDNTSGGDIAMTAPVLMAPAGEEIAMTSPMATQAEGWWMAFVLPQGLDAASAPVPNDHRVEIIDIAGPRMASLSYSGLMDEESNTSNAERLRAWIDERGLQASSGFQVAGYNPPWTIPFLRRNEILIELN